MKKLIEWILFSRPKPVQRGLSDEDEELQRALAISIGETGQSSSGQFGYQG